MSEARYTHEEIVALVAERGLETAALRVGSVLFAVRADALENDAPLPFRTGHTNIMDAARAIGEAGGPPSSRPLPSTGMVYVPITKGDSPYEDFGVGRARNCDVVLRAPSVSKLHARLRFQGSTLLLTDVGSTHGTRVGGIRIAKAMPTPIIPGHRIRFGDLEVTLVALEDVKASARGSMRPPKRS